MINFDDAHKNTKKKEKKRIYWKNEKVQTISQSA